MQRLSTTLALSALLVPAARADEASEAQEQAQVTFDKMADLDGAGIDYEQPPIIVDRGPGWADDTSGANPSQPEENDESHVDWKQLENDFDAAGASLVAAADSGAPADLGPFEEVVAKWKAQVADRMPFTDLDDFGDGVPPIVIDRGFARDLWARGSEVSLLRSVEVLRDATAQGSETPEMYGEVRRQLYRRANILGEKSEVTQALQEMLTEAEGRSEKTGAELERFRLALTAQRALQAARVAEGRQTAKGLRLSDRERFGQLVEHYHGVRQESLQLRSEPYDHQPVR